MSAQPPRITPPPLPVIPPQPRPGKMPIGIKIVLMGAICCVLMIGALVVWLMAYDRQSTNTNVSEEITAQWGDRISLSGPFISVEPDTDSLRPAGLNPAKLDIQANVETMTLHRSIYEAEVFTAAIAVRGHFKHSDLKDLTSDSIRIYIDLDPQNITETGKLKVGDREYDWQRSDASLYTYINISDAKEDADIPFNTSIKARGSGGIYFMPLADNTTISITGNAPNPSFSGETLPTERTVGKDGFTARWEISDSNLSETDYRVLESVGAKFLIGVDRYQKVCRAIKYAFIIIVLTFFSVFFTEITMRHPIPMFNYFLIGVALILFYSLLLGLSEHLSFGLSYLIAAIMTVVLITCYMWKMLNSKGVGLAICSVLSIIYGFCYVMLCISTYALLFGSLMLFVALAATMYGSLKIQYR